MDRLNKEVIAKEMIFLDKNFGNQDEILKFIVENAKMNDYILDEVVFLKSVKKREEEVSTAIGYSIAIPHGKSETVNFPFISLVRTKKEIRWTENNEEMVRLVFLIGVPEKSEGKLHLKFISQLSKKLLDDNFREKLLTESDRNKVFTQLNLIEI